MTGLPKKFAKMGFAKGWRAFKASKNRRSTNTQVTTKTMARRRRTTTKRRYYRRSSGMGMKGLGKLALTGAIYGIARDPVNQLAAKVPVVGSFGDEVTMLAVGAIAAWKGKGMIKEVGQAAVLIESYNLSRGYGGNLLSGLTGLSTSSTSTTENSFR